MKLNETECPKCDRQFIEPDDQLYDFCPYCVAPLTGQNDRNNLANVVRSFNVE